MKLLCSKKQQKLNTYKILFKTYQAKVYRVAYYIGRNEQDAKDIVQESFAIAYNKIDTLRNPDKFESWICTIACNLAKDKYRKGSKEILIDDYEKLFFLTSTIEPFENTEELLEKKELEANILKHIQSLDSCYRHVILLHYYSELSYEEIARVLDIKHGTVKSRMHRAKKILKASIIKDEMI